MARMSLRAYNQEIEGLIDSHQFDQAVAHCQHILRYYPKHIETYKLLGKSYLENQRYGDAADIFQRVLSSLPDDFVSHVGMSIIREDEGNLDEAIWHMERAFDAQPANSAIQRELSRLYGRRDGLEPPKVRLTRGALARMYIKGDLYPQAISEIRVALKDAPQRHDLLVLLAQAHFRAGQRFEAAEVCSKLLMALPHCLEANYILGEVLANSERAAEAKTFQMRAQALNPYLAHVTPNAPIADKVPDSAVVIEKMIWSPGKTPQQPAWAASLGVDLEDSTAKPETMPDWLAESEQISPEPQQVDGFSISSPPSEDNIAEMPPSQLTDAKLPGWMQEAGWTAGSGVVEEGKSPFAEEDQPDDQLAPAEMPEWLRSITPSESVSESEFLTEETFTPEPESPKPRSTGSLPWIDDTPASSDADTVASFLQDKEIPVTGELQADQADESVVVPEWLQGMLDEPEQASAELAPQDEALPTKSLEISALDSSPIDTTVDAALEATDLDGDQALAWLENLAEKQGVSDGLLLTPEERREALPDWLDGSEEVVAFVAPPVIEEFEPEAQPAQEIPEWLSQPLAGDKEEAEVSPSFEADIEKIQTTPEADEWLAEDFDFPETMPIHEPAMTLPGESELEEPSLPEEPSIPEEPSLPEEPSFPEELPLAAGTAAMELPEWLREAEIDQPQVDLPGFAMLFSPTESQKLAESLQTEGQLTLEEPPVIEGDTAPIFIRPAEPEPVEVESKTLEDEGIPDWLEDLEVEALPSQVDLTESTPVQFEVAESKTEPVTETTDEDAAFAWLEGLAARQGAEEALLLQPEERIEEAPSWVVQAIEEDTGPAPGELQAEELPASIEAISEAEDLTVSMEAIPEAEEISASLEALPEAEQLETSLESIPETVDVQQTMQPEQIDAETRMPELPTWLVGLDQETAVRDEAGWQPPEEIPAQETAPQIEGIPADRPRLNINEAGLVDLERLPGIGFIKAQAILEYHEQHGDFTQVDELLNVPGMGPAILDHLRHLITVGALPEAETLEPLSEDQISLVQARNALVSGNVDQIVTFYQHLITTENMLPEVINDLNEALYRFPVEISLWEALGDAYFRADRLQDALDAYTKAEELLR